MGLGVSAGVMVTVFVRDFEIVGVSGGVRVGVRMRLILSDWVRVRLRDGSDSDHVPRPSVSVKVSDSLSVKDPYVTVKVWVGVGSLVKEMLYVCVKVMDSVGGLEYVVSEMVGLRVKLTEGVAVGNEYDTDSD